METLAPEDVGTDAENSVLPGKIHQHISCALLSVNEHFSRGNWHRSSEQHQRHLQAEDSREHEACLHPSWNSRHIIHSLIHMSTQKPLTPTITRD